MFDFSEQIAEPDIFDQISEQKDIFDRITKPVAELSYPEEDMTATSPDVVDTAYRGKRVDNGDIFDTLEPFDIETGDAMPGVEPRIPEKPKSYGVTGTWDGDKYAVEKGAGFGLDAGIKAAEQFEETGPRVDKRSFPAYIASQAARGGVDALKALSGAMRMTDFDATKDEGVISGAGKKLGKWAEKVEKKYDILQPDIAEGTPAESKVKGYIGGAIRSTPSSLLPLAVGGATALATGNPILGAGAGFATLFSTFGLGQYQNSYDEIEKHLQKKGLPENEIKQKAAWHAALEAGAEVGGELAGDAASLAFFGVFGKQAVKQGVKQTIKQLISAGGAKEFGKALLKAAPFEAGSEMWTAAIQTTSRRELGMTNASVKDSVIDAGWTAAIMSLFFGMGIRGMQVIEARNVLSDLNSSDVDKRSTAVKAVSGRLEKEDAEIWTDTALTLIKSGSEIPISKPITDFAIQKADIDKKMPEPVEAPTLKPTKAEPTVTAETPVSEPIPPAAMTPAQRQAAIDQEFGREAQAQTQAEKVKAELAARKKRETEWTEEAQKMREGGALTGEQTAEAVNKALPGHDLKFDGIQEDAEGNPAFYQFTAYSGPAAKATFNVKSPAPADVQAALEAKIEQFATARKPVAEPIEPAQAEPATPTEAITPAEAGKVPEIVDGRNRWATDLEILDKKVIDERDKIIRWSKNQAEIDGWIDKWTPERAIDGVYERYVRGLGSASGKPLKKGETWRGRLVEMADREEAKSTVIPTEAKPAVEPAAKAPEMKAAGKEALRAGSVVDMPVSEISVDSLRFQYKRHMGKGGVSGKLRDIKKFDKELGGTVSVWEDPDDGKTYVVNGHHRFELAKRTGEKTITVRYLKAKDEKEAKWRGAIINIAENQGTPEDAAVLLREQKISPQELEEKYNVSLKGEMAKKGASLSQLNPTLFDAVLSGELPQNQGIAIGENLKNHDAQDELYKFIKREQKKGRTISADLIEQVIKDIGGAATVTQQQASLFGTEIKTRPLLIERAELRDYAVKKLAADKRLFKTVSDTAKANRLTIAGNTINIEGSRTIAEQAETIGKVFDALAGSKGEISDLLNEYAKRLNDARDKAKVKQEFLERLSGVVARVISGAEGRGPEGSRADAERGIDTKYPTGTQESIDKGFDQVKEALDLFGQKKPGQQTMFAKPELPKRKAERGPRKEKRPEREAQIGLFTGKQERPIQPALFGDFVKKPVKGAEKKAEQLPDEKGGIQSAGGWVTTSPTGRVFEAPSAVVNNSDEVASLLAPIRNHARESLYTVTVDKNGNIIELFEHSKGTKSNSSFHPIETAGHILNLPNASKVYFVHNHPSGDIAPSPEDIAVHRIAMAALDLKNIESEAIIIGSKTWAPVFADLHGRIVSGKIGEAEIKPAKGEKRIEAVESIISRGKRGEIISGSADFKRVIADKYKGQEGILFFDTKNHDIGFMPWPAGKTFKEASAQILAAAAHLNAGAYGISLNKPLTYENRAGFISAFVPIFQTTGLQLHEIYEGGRSYADTGLIDRIKSAPSRLGYPEDQIGLLKGLKRDEILYATREQPSGATLTLEDLQSLKPFQGGTVLQHGDGWFSVSFPGNKGFFIKTVPEIKENEAAFYAEYKRGRRANEIIAGSYTHSDTPIIHITKGVGDKWTVTKELQHFLEKSGLLTTGEIEAIERQAQRFNRGNYFGTNGRARWIEHELRTRSKRRESFIGRLIQKIADILDGFWNIFTQTARGAVRAIESGKPMTRTAQAEVNEFSQPVEYSLKQAVKNIMDNPNFRKWFGKSKVVDADGNPLVVYHGTPDPTFNKFSKKEMGGMGGKLGFWFASTGEAATQFARDRYAGQGAGIYPVYLSIKNPMIFNGWKDFTDTVDKHRGGPIESGIKRIRSYAQKRGYDGIIIKNSNTDMGGMRDDYVAFEPTQIKSIFNRGTYSLTNPDIAYTFAGAKGATAEGIARLDTAKQMQAEGAKRYEARERRYAEDRGEDGVFHDAWRVYDNKEKAWDSKIYTNKEKAENVAAFKNEHSLNKSREEIWQKTGWWEIVPGQWSFEIDDSVGMLKSPLKSNIKLDKAIDHPEIFKVYPWLKDVNFKIDDSIEGAYYDSGTNTIATSDKALQTAQGYKSILHEVQHAIQEHEGFARGGSPTPGVVFTDKVKQIELENLKSKGLKDANQKVNKAESQADYEKAQKERRELEQKINDLEKDPYVIGPKKTYFRLTGEAEARLVEKRRNMTPDQRKAEPPWITLERMLKDEGLLKEGQKPEDVLISRKGEGVAYAITQDAWKDFKGYSLIPGAVNIYRGKNAYQKGSQYYSPSKEWARQFTQSGLEKEVVETFIKKTDVYIKDPLPEATSETQHDLAIKEAIDKGYKAIMLSEGRGEPNSIYRISKRDVEGDTVYATKVAVAEGDVAYSTKVSEEAESNIYSGLPEDVRNRLKESGEGLGVVGLKDKAIETAKRFKNSFTRARQHLDPNTQGHFFDILRLQQEVPVSARYKTIEAITGFLKVLKTPEQRRIFELQVIIPDLVKDVENGLYDKDDELPFGFTDISQLKKYNDHLKSISDKDIDTAVKKRTAFMNDLRKDLVDNGILKEDVLEDDRYFHHQVLLYRAAKNLEAEYRFGTGASAQELRLKKKGWQRERKGSIEDYSTHYLESEAEIISQAIVQIETKKTMDRLQDVGDIRWSLQQQSKSENTAKINEIFEGQEDPFKPFNIKIAMGMTNLAKMATKGQVEYSDSKYDSIVEKLSDSYEQYKADKKDYPDEPERWTKPGVDDPLWFKFLSHLLETGGAGSKEAATIFKGIWDKHKFIKEALGNNYKTWRDFVPDGYTTWQPKPDGVWFMTNSLPDQLLEKIRSGEKDLPDKLYKVWAKGTGQEWVVPTGLAKSMDSFNVLPSDHWFAQGSKTMISAWKQWTLMNPYRIVKYNINNMSGDIDIVMACSPEILAKKYFYDSMTMLNKERKGKGLSEDDKQILDLARKLGVISSGWTMQEVTGITSVMSHKEFMQVILGEKPNIFEKYWKSAQAFTTFRENILRLAAFRYFQDQIAKGKTPGENLNGASNRKELQSAKAGGATNEELAAKLARELVGDYGNISEAGQWLRQHMIPFYSWMEINAPRYVRLMRNLKHEGKDTKALSGAMAWKATKLGLKAGALYGLVMFWNRMFFPKEDDELGDEKRRQLHLILGRRKDGSIISLRFQGALSDALEWFGLGDFPQDINDVIRKKQTVWDKAKEAAKAPFQRIILGARPIVRMVGEVLTERALYPDISMPRPIRDKWEHIARTFSLSLPYSWVAGKPKRGNSIAEQLFNDALSLGLYSADPGEGAYYDTRKAVFNFLDKKGIQKPSVTPTDKGNALYYYKQALKYGDLKAAKKYLTEYKELGGTKKGAIQSIKLTHPLSGIPDKMKSAFVKSLDEKQKEVAKRAIKWYNQTYRTKQVPSETKSKTTIAPPPFRSVYVPPKPLTIREATRLNQ